MFVATETARDVQQLARQMGRGEVKAASVAWAMAGEVARRRTISEPDREERQAKAEVGGHGVPGSGRADAGRTRDADGGQIRPGALPGSLQRIGDPEGAAERLYRASVEARCAADRTSLPRLSSDAKPALVALRAAPDQAARGRVWQEVEKAGAIAGEIAAFGNAVERRLGADSVRHMMRTEGRAGAVIAPSVATGQRTALDQEAERISTIWSGERAGTDLTLKQAETHRLTLRRGMRM